MWSLLVGVVKRVFALYRQWRFTEVSMKLLAMLIRHDTLYPVKGVQLFANALVHDALNIRKVRNDVHICINSL